MLIVGGVCTCLAGMMYLITLVNIASIGRGVPGLDGVMSIVGFTGVFLLLAGIFIALSYKKILQIQKRLDRLES